MSDQKYNILYVDDEEANLRVFKSTFFREFNIFTATSAQGGLELLRTNEIHLVITDQRMPKVTGVEFLTEVRRRYPEPNLILLSAYTDFDALKEAVNDLRIYHFINKPYDPDHLRGVIQNALEHYQLRKDKILADKELREAYAEIETLKNQLEAENTYLKEEIKRVHDFENIIGTSNALKFTLSRVQTVGVTDATVLLLGESGTGKELIARAIHTSSPRHERPLVKVNCAALPADLIESELFGYEKGAFSGATERRMGRFELADKTTLFLDEIGELPLPLQAKLLRTLEYGEFERLGSGKTVNVDVRIIAATNRDLEKEMEEGRFRKDLWYRLNVYTITLPTLRERIEDVPLLVQHFVSRFNKRFGRQITKIPDGVLEKLKNYAWPGNIRELQHVIERAVINTQGDTLVLTDSLKSPIGVQTSGQNGLKTIAQNERDHILQVLDVVNWKIEGPAGAAQILDLNPGTLRSRMKKLGIQKP